MELGVKGRVHTYASILLGLIRERVDWVSRDLRRRQNPPSAGRRSDEANPIAQRCHQIRRSAPRLCVVA